MRDSEGLAGERRRRTRAAVEEGWRTAAAAAAAVAETEARAGCEDYPVTAREECGGCLSGSGGRESRQTDRI